jgi:outer membrane protein assembly factor BamD (BamD/ComL family)
MVVTLAKRTRRAAGVFLGATLLVGVAGCWEGHFTWRQLNPFEPAVIDPETETFVLRPEGLLPEKNAATVDDKVGMTLAAGRDHFRREEYDKAESFFGRIAENEKNPPPAVQEAIYYQAECLRLTGHYPKSADLYASLLQKFPNSSYREQCVQHMFDIANYWLDDTREAMREDKERREGKRWFVWPRFVSTEKTKPFLDREGRAVETLEKVRLNDINGPLADEALFMCGVVKMYNENYREASYYFSQIHQRHPDSKRASHALKLAIFCKHMSTGGSDYDGRGAAEARTLIKAAMTSYPELSHDQGTREWLERQQVSIDMQQAEKDYKMAEFYRRTGHPGSAYFYYELVQRRYKDTKYAKMAKERWEELRGELEKKQPEQVGPAPQQPAPAAPAPTTLPPPHESPAALPAPRVLPAALTPPALPGSAS